jgi:hypothetical protein
MSLVLEMWSLSALCTRTTKQKSTVFQSTPKISYLISPYKILKSQIKALNVTHGPVHSISKVIFRPSSSTVTQFTVTLLVVTSHDVSFTKPNSEGCHVFFYLMRLLLALFNSKGKSQLVHHIYRHSSSRVVGLLGCVSHGAA